MTSGYSGTPLPRKLGVRSGTAVLADGAPAGFALDGAELDSSPKLPAYDVILLFCADRERLYARWPAAAGLLTSAGRLWVCWPKRASGLQTDLSESDVREHGLAHGLVDVKVCAIDATWSGLAFVRRLADR